MEPDKSPIGDYVASWLRTTVPVLWGMLLTWVASLIPGISNYLNSQAMIGIGVVIAGAVTVVWYSVWRKVEEHLPPMLTRLLLGANSRPVYPAVIDGQVLRSTTSSPNPPVSR